MLFVEERARVKSLAEFQFSQYTTKEFLRRRTLSISLAFGSGPRLNHQPTTGFLMASGRGSDLLVECLENEQVQYVFHLPGEETLAITDSLGQSKSIKLVTVRHEQGAAFMAGVYGRWTVRAGVCVATLGPETANLATGMQTAEMYRSPLVWCYGRQDM